MTISAQRQFLSNMLWRLFAFLILGGLIAICSCEPVNRKDLLKSLAKIECADDDDGSACGETNRTDDDSSQNTEVRTYTSRRARQKLDDDDVTNQGTFALIYRIKLHFIFQISHFQNIVTNLDNISNIIRLIAFNLCIESALLICKNL